MPVEHRLTSRFKTPPFLAALSGSPSCFSILRRFFLPGEHNVVEVQILVFRQDDPQ